MADYSTSTLSMNILYHAFTGIYKIKTAGMTSEGLPEIEVFLRKEVIQPHLPVRLPCYDFAPVIGLTFDSSPPCGLGHRLRVLPTPMA